MGRRLTGGWVESRKRWMARIGPIGPNGKRTAIVLRGANGRPLRKDEKTLVPCAIARQQAESEGQLPNDVAAAAGWTLADVCREFLAWSKREGRRPRTLESHAYRIRRFLAFTGDKPAGAVTAEDWFRFNRSPIGGKPQTFQVMRTALQWAARPIDGRRPLQIIPVNPFANIRISKPKAIVSPASEWAETRSIIRTMRAHARQRVEATGRIRRTRINRWLHVACITFQAHTGCRTAEAVGLTWAEVDLAAGVIRLDPDRVKTNKRRTIPIGHCRRLIEAIGRIPCRHATLVFWPAWGAGNEKSHWRWLREDVKPWAATQGRAIPDDWQPYDLRRSWATDAIEIIGEDAASTVLGHSPEVLRTIYDRPGDRRAKTAGEAVAKGRRKKS
jgi:integrase